jgi:BirA family biotin operon repressor/biotin-[acetyl-CoA-carboxylase] ligase
MASLHFCLPKQAPYFINLSQLLSVSTCKALETLGFFVKIKWPNDLIMHSNGSDKKLGGILCELLQTSNWTNVIIGIGLNVNLTEEHTSKIDQPATSLLLESGKTWSCDKILQNLLHNFIKDLAIIENKGFTPFHPYYESRLTTKGKQVLIKDGAFSLTGLCQGISPEGKLLLLLPNGSQKEVCSGQIE